MISSGLSWAPKLDLSSRFNQIGTLFITPPFWAWGLGGGHMTSKFPDKLLGSFAARNFTHFLILKSLAALGARTFLLSWHQLSMTMLDVCPILHPPSPSLSLPPASLPLSSPFLH